MIKNFSGQVSLIFECITGHFTGQYILALTVHTVLGYSTAFGSFLLQEEVLISSGLRQIPTCGVRILQISLIHVKPIYMGWRENIAQLIKVLCHTVQARIWHFSTTFSSTLSEGYLLAFPTEAEDITKISLIFFLDFRVFYLDTAVILPWQFFALTR